MGVVFDEVIATIEAPETKPKETEMSEQLTQDEGNHEEKINQVFEMKQRRAKRLWAD
jgi:hypothetical protein